MPHVVTQACCGDASCVFACPVNCIHPTPDEPDFATAEMLYIDPVSCVDCGACVRACPVGAIVPHTRLGEHDLPFVDINAAFHAEPRPRPLQAPVPPVVRLPAGRRLSVAIVGAGPAALYAADELLKQDGVRVRVLDRLPTPHGLVRAGVAPDHQETKQVGRLFRSIESQPGFAYRLGVEVGRDVTHEELAAHHDAVVYAVGAPADRRVGVPGEDLPGNATATEVVAWYNGHPDHLVAPVDLSSERVVVVGNGNVALDVARVLLTSPDRLAVTDVADHALAALRESRVREVVLLGRRGPEQAAFTLPELIGLLQRDDLDVVVEDRTLLVGDHPKVVALREGTVEHADRDRPRVVLRFLTGPVAVEGDDHVTGLRVTRTRLREEPHGRVVAEPTGEEDVVHAGTVLRSVGYRSVPVPGVPFDPALHRIPNLDGRVLDAPDGEVVPGTYVVGWAKRGPTGFIGTNKSCALETVNLLLADAAADRLPARTARGRAFDRLLADRCPAVLDGPAWERLDAHERRLGAPEGRPRRKLVDRVEMVGVAGAGRRR